jgi:hypothetical protein
MSDKKTISNRNNAQKSTGPASAAGRAVVSQNARTHGLLSRHLIIEGESQEDFNMLLCELVDEFQPVGLVEHALVERVAIAFWRQRRLVQAESANVSLNQQSFGSQQSADVRKALNLDFTHFKDIKPPEDSATEHSVATLQKSKAPWQSLLDSDNTDEAITFAALSEEWKIRILGTFKVTAEQIDAVIVNKYGSLHKMIKLYVSHYDGLIQQQRIREISRLVMRSQALPSKPELLARYQTALDNDLYKALKALRESQAWRQTRSVLAAESVAAE